MNQEKIGKFIAYCRKEKEYTQAMLAERLGITDRAVSKWETGKSLPDASLMLDLCNTLGITVNDLLTGERVGMDNYQTNAELNLMELTKQEELNNKKLLSLEKVIGYMSSTTFMVLVFSSSFAVEDTVWKAIMILVAMVEFVVGIVYCLRIEHDAGYYECPSCGWKYVPTMKAIVLSPHIGFNRKMKCPHCEKKGYHKKILIK